MLLKHISKGTVAFVLAAVIGMVLAGCASMRLDHLESDTVDGPKQVRQGQDIDPKLVTVWGIYKDGSRKVVSVSRSEITFNSHTPGPQTVKVRVGVLTSQEVSFQTEVMALRTLDIASQPRTALFKVGDEPDPTWPGLELRGNWDKMGSDKIDLASCEITGFMKNQPGKQTIKIAYEGITATFDIDVRAMTSIQIAQAPTKITYFSGDALDLTGLKVMGVWEGFPAEQLAITRNDVTGYNENNAGIQHVTVTKNGKSAIFDVEVMALTSIVLDKPPTKTDYKAGEALDLTGIIVNGYYTGANATKKIERLIPVNQLVVSGYEPNRVGRQQKVTVTVKGQNATFFVNIEAAPVTPNPPATSSVAPGTDFEFSNGRITKYLGNAKDLIIPASINGVQVTGINAGAFAGKKLDSVTCLAETLTYIGGGAFKDCGLKTVTFSKKVPSSRIDFMSDAFAGNPGITSITIGTNIVVNYGNAAGKTGFPESFEAYFWKYYGQAGTYTYKNGVWSSPDINPNYVPPPSGGK